MKAKGGAVEATKFLFRMCDCTVDRDVGTGDISLVPGIVHVCGHVHVRSHVSPDMDCLHRHFNNEHIESPLLLLVRAFRH